MESSQEPGEPRPTAAPPPPAARRPLTWGQQIASVLFLIVFLIAGLVVSWAQMRARHPH